MSSIYSFVKQISDMYVISPPMTKAISVINSCLYVVCNQPQKETV